MGDAHDGLCISGFPRIRVSLLPLCAHLSGQSGYAVSVLSALARRELDPWQEAARLAQLPEETAVAQIVALLDSLPHQKVAAADQAGIATRLSALLPRRAQIHSSALNAISGGVTAQQQDFASSMRFFLFYLFLMIVANWVMAGRQTTSNATANVQSDAAAASASRQKAPNENAH